MIWAFILITSVGMTMKHDFESILGRVANWVWRDRRSDALESFRPGQIMSKKWLVFEIIKFKTEFNKVAVLGSWNSILLYELLSVNADVKEWHFYDINYNHHIDRANYMEVNGIKIAETFFDADVTGLFKDPDVCKEYDLIINPSCEHMNDIEYQAGPLYALCSTNKTNVREHINTIQHHEDLAVKNNIKKVLYEGTLSVENYERYCTVGYVE